MTKRKVLKIGVIVISIIVLLIAFFLLYRYIRIKTARVEIVLKTDRQVTFLDDVKVSSFIESINGKIVDDYKIDTTKIGSQNIEFTFINDQNIKLNYSYELSVIDDEAPLIWLGKSYNVTRGSNVNLLDKILCGDNYDSKPDCEIIGEYNLDTVGSYDLVFKATDSSGNTNEKKFTLNVNEPKNSSSSSNNGTSYTDFSQVVEDYKNDKTQIGIDVSKWQQDIDFQKLKDAGVEFVFIRVGTSSGINGENFLDSKFIQNIDNANAVGIPVGVYFYSYANSLKRAQNDAKWVLDQIKDYQVDLGIAFDWENWQSFNEFNLSFFGLTNMAKEFMNTVTAAGYKSMLYSSKTYLENIWLPTDYPVWLAHYTKNTDYKDDYEYWQICSNGKVDGINGLVDIDIRYLS